MKNNQLFKIILIIFVIAVIVVLIDMARQTTAPWNKKKQVERVIQK